MNDDTYAASPVDISCARCGCAQGERSSELSSADSKGVSRTAGRTGFALLAAICIVALPIFHAAEQPVNVSDTMGTSSDKPINVIFDTDMWSDIDDMLALAMLNALQDRHEVNLVAVTLSTEDPWSASYVDAVNTFYGHPQIPIGMVHHGVTGEATRKRAEQGNSGFTLQKTPYVQWISERHNPDGTPVFPHRLIDGSKAPDATTLLRKTLAAQPDGSVVMVRVGLSTNLARLLDSPADHFTPLEARENYSLAQWRL